MIRLVAFLGILGLVAFGAAANLVVAPSPPPATGPTYVYFATPGSTTWTPTGLVGTAVTAYCVGGGDGGGYAAQHSGGGAPTAKSSTHTIVSGDLAGMPVVVGAAGAGGTSGAAATQGTGSSAASSSATLCSVSGGAGGSGSIAVGAGNLGGAGDNHWLFGGGGGGGAGGLNGVGGAGGQIVYGGNPEGGAGGGAPDGGAAGGNVIAPSTAPAFVQALHGADETGSMISSLSTSTGAPFGAGHYIVGSLFYSGGSDASITDITSITDGTNSYPVTPDKFLSFPIGSGHDAALAFVGPAHAGATAITVNFTVGNVGFPALQVHEVANLTGTIDQFSQVHREDISSVSQATPTITTVGNEYLYAFLLTTNNDLGATTVGAPYTLKNNVSGVSQDAENVLSAGTPTAATFTVTTTGAGQDAAIGIIGLEGGTFINGTDGGAPGGGAGGASSGAMAGGNGTTGGGGGGGANATTPSGGGAGGSKPFLDGTYGLGGGGGGAGGSGTPYVGGTGGAGGGRGAGGGAGGWQTGVGGAGSPGLIAFCYPSSLCP